MTRRALTAFAGLAVAVLAAGGARADANLNCDAYAGAAVAQNQQNVARAAA